MGRYCSPACHYADRQRVLDARRVPKVRYICGRCGVEFERAKGRGLGIYCSTACKRGPKLAEPLVLEVVPPPERHTRKKWNTGSLTCVVCGKRAQRHHAIYEQHVVAREPRRRYDIANRVGLCRDHHRGHHDRVAVLPIALLPDSVIEFAVDVLGDYAEMYLRRYYAGDDPRLADLPLTGR